MASLSDVAARAGVSVSTASSVLNPGRKPKFVSEEITGKVREAARELGYVSNYHARSMKLRRAMAIGVALDMPATNATPRSEIGSSFFGTLFGSVAVTARRAGYITTLIGPDGPNRATWRGAHAVQQRQLDGLVVLAMLDESHSDTFYVQPPDVPVVAIEPCVKTSLPAACWDVPSAVDEVIEHLAAQGHVSMLWLGPEPQHGTTPAAQRELLFMQKMWDRGLRGQSCRYPREEAKGTTSVGETYLDPARDELLRRLAGKGMPDFTAVVCFNDTTALGAMAALRQHKLRVPEDVSVTGFDDTEAIFGTPKITTFRQPLELIGSRAFELLLEMIEDREKVQALHGHRDMLRGEMVIRDSTARARG